MERQEALSWLNRCLEQHVLQTVLADCPRRAAARGGHRSSAYPEHAAKTHPQLLSPPHPWRFASLAGRLHAIRIYGTQRSTVNVQ